MACQSCGVSVGGRGGVPGEQNTMESTTTCGNIHTAKSFMKYVLRQRFLLAPSNHVDHTDSLLKNLSAANLQNASSSKDLHASCDNKYRKLFDYEEAPGYLKHNEYIRTGYRGMLNTKLCLESVFWWTNETINIWSHLFGFFLFLGLTVKDMTLIDMRAPLQDKILVGIILLCFQVCMVLSSMYHTFSCRSEKDFHCFLSYDLFGIALSLLAIYTSGIYYAFWCDRQLRIFYMISVTVIFIVAMMLQHPKMNFSSHTQMLVFILWALYGVIPTVHWTIKSGGIGTPIVQILLPRVLGMYVISGAAFLVYITKVPERFFAGKFDYLGHSHQWWHIIIVLALYYWHNSGVIYIEYRMNHACGENAFLY